MTTKNKINFKSAAPNPMFNHVLDITPEELFENRTKVKIIDVRRHDEWVGEFGHIKEAELLTLDTLPKHLDKLPKDHTVVFVCRSGGRSAQAAAIAMQNNCSDVYNMKGGMIAWTDKKLATTK
jgi:hydroxyacylglutathione hydrolase